MIVNVCLNVFFVVLYPDIVPKVVWLYLMVYVYIHVQYAYHVYSGWSNMSCSGTKYCTN